MVDVIGDLALAGCDLQNVLLGLVAPAAVASAGCAAGPGGGEVMVPLAGDGYARSVWIDVRRGLVTREMIAGPDGQVLMDRRLRKYRRIGPLLLPGRVELRQDGATILLEYRSCALDRGLTAARLRQGLPRDGLQRLP